MGMAYGTHEGNKEIHIGFLLGSQLERDHQQDLDTGGRITLKSILDKYDRGMCIGYW
jgi:hypothetical protein